MTVSNKDKRILWLINHTTLRESEVPLLISLGYEIYTPKYIPNFIYEWSGSVDYNYDKTLTIPEEALKVLNQHNFYEPSMNPAVVSIINQYFGAAFCLFHPELLNQITLRFNGNILLRAFGLDKTRSYSQALESSFGNKFLQRLKLLGDRFWFSQSYPNLHEVEGPLFQARKIYHPLGLSKKFFENQNSWIGGTNKVLFFCARINTAEYYGSIYKNFKKNFGDLPHVIAGNQPITVKDPHVVGYQSRDTIEKWLSTFNVMFYHSEEPRHLHYHPLEAIVHGMPLIFMKKGILGKICDNQPGACETFKEAHEKISRILRNDQEFISQIRERQTVLLKSFTQTFCRETWEKNFVHEVMQPLTPVSTNHVKTVGVFLPVGYRGGSLNGAKNVAKMLHLGSRNANEPINVIFSCVANEYDIEEEFADLIELGIPIRETRWKTILRDEVKIALKFSGTVSPELNYLEYTMPSHGVSNFNECDFWLLISDRLVRPLAPLKPYGMVIYDYIQRYVPAIFNTAFMDTYFIATARHANAVLTTTPTTREDAIQYAGLTPYRTHLAPMEFDTFNYSVTPKKTADQYFIWPSNATQHKNHLNAIKALHIYYKKFNGKFKVILTGPHTDSFINNDQNKQACLYFKDVINLLEKYPHVKKHLTIAGNLSIEEYISTLQSAKFLWHPAIIDNGTYAVIEAAFHNVPSLSSNYPQMHYINERFDLNLSFGQALQPHNMAMQLKEMEENHSTKQQLLPKKEFLEQFSYKKVAPEFWSLIRGLI